MQELIAEFMNKFYGYGNLEGRYWFIGLEEGCGPNWETDVAPRFEQWQIRGKREIEDVRAYHEAFGVTHHWEPPEAAVIQPTWRRLIQATITAQTGSEPNVNEIRAYQVNRLGTPTGETCLVEFLPLPSPNLAHFGYAHLANDDYPFFAAPGLYAAHIRDTRIRHIRHLITHHGAAHVVFYGLTNLAGWNEIVMHAPWEVMDQHIQRCHFAGRCIWLVPQPAAFGLPGNVFTKLGHMMRAADAQGGCQDNSSSPAAPA